MWFAQCARQRVEFLLLPYLYLNTPLVLSLTSNTAYTMYLSEAIRPVATSTFNLASPQQSLLFYWIYICQYCHVRVGLICYNSRKRRILWRGLCSAAETRLCEMRSRDKRIILRNEGKTEREKSRQGTENSILYTRRIPNKTLVLSIVEN